MAETIGYGALVRGNRNFRYLWWGQIVSLLGDWFNLIASASLTAQLTESGFAIGGLFVVRMLAPFLVSPVAGVVADRYDRKQILVITDVVRGVTVLGFLLVRRPEDVWLLYVLTGIQFAASGFFFPARNAILPDVVSNEALGAANALTSATWSVMLALGAALGGVVAGIWGNETAFVVDALTFGLSAVLLWQIRYRATTSLDSERTIRAGLTQYLDGLRYLRRYRDIFFIVLHKAAVTWLVSSGFQVLQVTISEKVFVIGEGGSIGLGLLYMMVGIGTGVGPIAGRWWTGDDPRLLRRAIVGGYLVAAVGLFMVATLQSFGFVLAGTFFRGIGAGLVWVFSTQLLLQLVPNAVRGRVFATEFAIHSLSSAVGAAMVGGLVDVMSIGGMLNWMGALTVLPAGLWLLWLIVGKQEMAGEVGTQMNAD